MSHRHKPHRAESTTSQPAPAHLSPKPAATPPNPKAALLWLLIFLAVALAIFVAVMPPGYRLRVVVAFALVAPLSVWCLFYVLRERR